MHINLPPFLCRLCISILHLWLWVERLVIRITLPLMKKKVIDFYRLEKENKGIITVKNPTEFYVNAANKSLLGFCESYMNGWITITRIDEAVANILKSGTLKHDPGYRYKAFLDWLEFEVFHVSGAETSVKMAETHYNLGNDLFERMLGEGMNYSCALWTSPTDTLCSAQRNKMDLLARKMKLKKGMRVLDIGCGWGGMAKFLAKEYGVHVTATTTSIEGAKYAKDYCKGLSVDVRISDCRDLIEGKEKFDRILAIEVLVHVGKKNYSGFFKNVEKCLKDDGIFVLHAIGSNDPLLPAVNNLHNTIIPDSRIPYIKDIIEGTEGLFLVEDWANIGANYDKTAMAWNDNFQKGRGQFVSEYGERFCRMWEFFMQTNAAVSRTRNLQIWHVVFSKLGNGGIKGGYSY